MEKTAKRNFELDCCYKESEILEFGLKPLNVPKLNYIIYEDDSKIYFFEQIKDDLFRLYCKTSKKSYYLS